MGKTACQSVSKTKCSSGCSFNLLPNKRNRTFSFLQGSGCIMCETPAGSRQWSLPGSSVTNTHSCFLFLVEKKCNISNSVEKDCMSPLVLVRRLLKYSYLPTAGFSTTAVLCTSERVHTQIKPSDIRAHHNKLKHIQARRHKWGEMGTRTPPAPRRSYQAGIFDTLSCQDPSLQLESALALDLITLGVNE